VDYHPRMQEVALVETETGEYDERQLSHGHGEAEKFYRDLKQRGVNVRVGMEAAGHARWFERLIAELGFDMPLAGLPFRPREPAAGSPYRARNETRYRSTPESHFA